MKRQGLRTSDTSRDGPKPIYHRLSNRWPPSNRQRCALGFCQSCSRNLLIIVNHYKLSAALFNVQSKTRPTLAFRRYRKPALAVPRKSYHGQFTLGITGAIASFRRLMAYVKRFPLRENLHEIRKLYATVRYPGDPAVSIRKYAYPTFELDHAVPLPPTRFRQL